MDLIDGAAVLDYVGIAAPTPEQETRADEVAASINTGITTRLDWPEDRVATAAELAELEEAARVAAAELWARRRATFGVTGYADADGAAIRVARDPLAGVAPMIDRHREGASGSFG